MSDNSNQEREQFSGRQRRQIARPTFCQFCTDKEVNIDYKNEDLLHRYVQEDGKIRPRRQTGTCAHHQRMLAREIKRARHIALLPFVADRWSDSGR